MKHKNTLTLRNINIKKHHYTGSDFVMKDFFFLKKTFMQAL